MKSQGFTLIELLVVVAIIGILAAVGVVAYNGYTKSAKASAAKANHKLMVKILTAEVMKCVLGHKLIFDNRANCSGFNAGHLDGYAQYWFMKTGSKNPYDTSARYPARSAAPWYFGPWTDKDVGYVNTNVLYQDKDLYIQTCIRTPCTDSKNILNDTIKDVGNY
ncbi:prepilin-type N-terminal cleavage/methylation domain-containing protein [Candidatus Pelagibacter sp.]|nr:prepilin-type N-terminal cleavage/methylation domain-containing protein [Candidatus Pelagibacter sp.]